MSAHGQGVFTPELRFQWVKGQVTSGTPDGGFVACGDGTGFPMEVTLDQLAEIMYRVRYAWMLEGSYSASFDLDPEDPAGFANIAYYAPKVAPPTDKMLQLFGSDPYFRLEMGYFTSSGEGEEGIVLDNEDAYFGVEYTEEIDEGSFYYIAHVRDIIDNERGMWVFPNTSTGHPRINLPAEFRCGMSYFIGDPDKDGTPQTQPASTDEGPGAFDGHSPCGFYEDAFGASNFSIDLDVSFSGLVAYTGTTPLDTGGRIFIGMRFAVRGIDRFEVPRFILHTNPSVLTSPVDSELKFTLRLHDSTEISCPLFRPDDDSYLTSTSGEDWVLEARSWWPYAKDSPALPVWNTETGAKL